MTQEQTQEYVKGCIRGEPPQCAAACPFAVDVKDMLTKAGKQKWSSAYKSYRNAVVFPAIVAELCPEPCRNACVIREKPIEINAIERAIMANVKKRAADFYAIPPKDKTVAVVGANVEGLTCALMLAQKQYKVTVFDNSDSWGGSIKSNANFAVFEQDFHDQFAGVSVDFRYNSELSGDFDAIYRAADEGNPIAEIAKGKQAAIEIEHLIQTANAPTRSEITVPASDTNAQRPEYNADSASVEANRCKMCNCGECLDACAMLRSFRKDPKRLAVDFFVDANVNPPLSTHTMTREAYSCTDCKACKSACPKNIDLGNLFTAYRKMRADNGTVPTAFHDIFLRRMNDFNSKGRYVPGKYLYFPGCSVSTDLPDTSQLVYEYLKNRYNAGIWEHCCGSPARWAAIDYDFGLTNQFNDVTVIYACPSCAVSLAQQFPDLKLLSVYELLASEIPDSRTLDGEYMLFHACAARDNDTLRNSVLNLLPESNIPQSDLKCCGYGGQTMVANYPLYKETADATLSESTLPYLVYCANCRDTFKSLGKECKHILELLFPADNNTEVFDMLTFSEDAQSIMDTQLIRKSDIWELIQYAEQSGDKLISDNGLIIASLERSALTYWVEYRILGDGKFHVENAYYHRMKFRQGG